MFLEIHDLTLFFGEKKILEIADIQIKEGELVTLLGPSGCGKSTLLRCITGLEQPRTGEIWLDQQQITETPTKDRNIGFVFQNYALFPTMTVFENVAFGLKVKKWSAQQIQEQVLRILGVVDMVDYADKNVQFLSGGQRQRVALARSLVTEPKVLLLDEPLSALDARIRKQLQRDIRNIQQSLGMTMIFVTHDQEEAMRISDRIFVMEEGRVAQVATSKELYQKPKSRFVADFIGNYNRFEWSELNRYTREFLANGNEFNYYLRPELIQFEPLPKGVKIPVQLKESYILGNIQRYVFQTKEEKEIIVDRLNNREEDFGAAVYIDLEDILAIPVEINTDQKAQYS